MKKKTIIAIVASFVVVMFAGCLDSTPNSATPSSALLMDNATQGSGNIVITHHGGDTIHKAFKETAPFWDSLEVRINDDICTGSVTLNGKSVSSGDFKPKDVLSISLSKNLESDDLITVVYKPTGKLLQRAKISSLTTPTATQTPTPKTELSLGESAIVEDISFTVVKYKSSDSYISTSTSQIENETRYPPEGAKFLWIYVKAKNVGDVKHYLPGRSDVDILYKGATLRGEFFRCHHLGETYGGADVYPGVASEGWILYEVPAGINMTQAKIRVEFPKAKGLYGSEICGTKTWGLAS